jgi:hypothetical protein
VRLQSRFLRHIEIVTTLENRKHADLFAQRSA